MIDGDSVMVLLEVGLIWDLQCKRMNSMMGKMDDEVAWR